MGFHCACCGQYHGEFPMDVGFAEPLPYHALSNQERARHAKLTTDTCVIDGPGERLYFVRGVLLLPVRDHPELGRFAWGAWVSLSAASFADYESLGEGSVPAGHGWFGWFCNRLPHYPETLNLKMDVYPQGGGERPHLRVQACDHPLYREQQNGITLARVHEFVDGLLERGK